MYIQSYYLISKLIQGPEFTKLTKTHSYTRKQAGK